MFIHLMLKLKKEEDYIFIDPLFYDPRCLSNVL